MFVETDGKFYRMRRGKLVEIPKEWLHKTPSHKTKAERQRAAKLKRYGRKHNKQAYCWPSQKSSPIIPTWDMSNELAGDSSDPTIDS